MKKIMMAMAVVLAGAAGAQTAVKTNEGEYKLLGCYVQNKQVLCDVSFTLTESDMMDKFHQGTTVFAVDGTQTKPVEFVYAGKPHNSDFTHRLPGGTVYKNIPVKLTIVTGLPTTATTIRALIVDAGNARWDNIAIRNGTAAAPAPAPAATLNIAGNWNATLTNCKQTNPGVVVCTATLKK